VALRRATAYSLPSMMQLSAAKHRTTLADDWAARA